MSQSDAPEVLEPVASEMKLAPLAPVPYTSPTARNDLGQFAPGTSGNPAGRPVSRKNQLTDIKQELELAIRRNISPEMVAQIVHRMYELALMGSVGAAKLILDKTVSNARSDDEEQRSSGGITIKIENLTVGPDGRKVIDVTPSHQPSAEEAF